MLYTTLYALAFVALLVGVVLLRTSLTKGLRLIASDLDAMRVLVRSVSGSQLRIELDALVADVDKLRKSQQKQFGTVWARLGSRDDIAGALMESDDPRAREVGKAHAQLGVGIAAPSPKECACGWCQTCEERKLRDVRRHTGVIA
jgi:hypothetical protein